MAVTSSARAVRATAVRATAVAVAALLTVATFAGPATARRKPAGTSTTTTTTFPPLPAFDSTVAWSDCGDGFQCGTLTVPVDWKMPHGDTVPLALVRRPAADPATRVGSLVINYGGPGQGGVDYIRNTWARLPSAVRDRFDLVSFDPRGTGASRPVDCVDDSFLDLGGALPAVPDSDAALTSYDRYSAALAQGCAQRMGTYAGQVGTRNAARDLEAIRIALGEPKLTYLGYSYGTILGMTYAQMYPGNVRALVLDGPPDYSLSARDYAYAQAQGFSKALDAFFAWCEQTSCALTRAGTPRDVLNQLIARIATDPIPASYVAGGVTREGTLNGSGLQSAVLSLLYDESRGWPLLADALRTAAQDGWGGPLLSYSDQYLGRSPGGHWSSIVEANSVISCVDRPATTTPTHAQVLAAVAAFQAQLPPWGGSWAAGSCVGMPEPATGDKLGALRVTGAPPILVVGTTGDPATPYAGARAMVSRIAGSGLLTLDSTEHTAFGSGRSTCVDGAVDAYLLGGPLPAAGTHCAPG